jgi:sec-independent protein translocase protein TatC
MSDPEKIPFIEHLGELKERLVRCSIAVGIGFCGAYFFKEKLFEILVAPLVKAMGENGNSQIIFTGLPEAFFTYLKVSLIADCGIDPGSFP